MEIGKYVLKRSVRVPSFEGVYAIPKGTKVEVIEVEGGLATVDFKDGYVDKFSESWCNTFLTSEEDNG